MIYIPLGKHAYRKKTITYKMKNTSKFLFDLYVALNKLGKLGLMHPMVRQGLMMKLANINLHAVTKKII